MAKVKSGNVLVDTPLGLVVGIHPDPRFGDNVEAFLGVKFASVHKGFSKLTLLHRKDDYNEEFINATEYGPFCWSRGNWNGGVCIR